MLKKILQAALNLVAVLSIGVIGVSIFAGFGFLTPMVVTSGSMEPTIMTGSFMLSKRVPASEISVGDITSLPREDGVLVTHRIVSAEPIGNDTTLFVMRGDANSADDQLPYVVKTALKPLVVIPELGKAASLVTNNKLILIGIGSFVLAFWIVMSMNFSPKPTGPKHRHEDFNSKNKSKSKEKAGSL